MRALSMAHYKTIPTPPGEAWRLMKTRFVPVAVFVVVLLTVVGLWRKYLSPATLPGEVEAAETGASSPQTGVITEIKARLFEKVALAQELGRVVVADPKNPSPITSTIEGNVTRIHHSAGDKVNAGDTIFTVTAARPDRITAFLRQPLRNEPVEGQPVLVRPRTHAAPARAEILRVGSQLAPIRESLLPSARMHAELGLPIVVSIPPELKLFPGEIVDLTLLPNPAKPAEPAPQADPTPAPTPAKPADTPKPAGK